MTTATQNVNKQNVPNTIDIKEADNTSFTARLNNAIDLSTTVSEVENHVKSQYFYSIGSYNFLIEDGLNAETLQNIKISKVPYLPKWHMGIISIRGIIMPVIDVHAFIQSHSKKPVKRYTDKPYFLKLEHQNHTPIVFKVDKLPRLIDIKKYKKSRAANKSLSWIKNYFKDGTLKLIRIDHDELLKQIIK